MQARYTHPSQMNIWPPLLMMAAFGIAIFYLVTAMNTQNWAWFLNETEHVTPSRIVVINNGTEQVYTQGRDGFLELSTAVEQSLSNLSNTALINIGLSEQTLTDYATRSLVVELYFDQPVRFNSMARTGEPTQLLIPVTGRHSGGGYVFRGAQGDWWFGAVRMADPEPLFKTLESLGHQ